MTTHRLVVAPAPKAWVFPISRWLVLLTVAVIIVVTAFATAVILAPAPVLLVGLVHKTETQIPTQTVTPTPTATPTETLCSIHWRPECVYELVVPRCFSDGKKLDDPNFTNLESYITVQQLKNAGHPMNAFAELGVDAETQISYACFISFSREDQEERRVWFINLQGEIDYEPFTLTP